MYFISGIVVIACSMSGWRYALPRGAWERERDDFPQDFSCLLSLFYAAIANGLYFIQGHTR